MISFLSLTFIYQKFSPEVFHKHMAASESTSKTLKRHWPTAATTYLFHVLISYGEIRTPVLINVKIKMKVRHLEISREETFETVQR